MIRWPDHVPWADRQDPNPQGWKLVVTLAGLAFLFMLLPAVNLVNLNVSRIMERASEIGVRKAFGASSRTLVAQFVLENVVLTLTGAVVGVLIAAAFLRLLNEHGPFTYAQLVINTRVLLYGLGPGRDLRRLLWCVSGMADVTPPSSRGVEGRQPVIRHILRLMWHRKRHNVLIGLEIFISYLVLLGVMVIGVSYATFYRYPLGYDIDRVWRVGIRSDFRNDRDEDKAAGRQAVQQVLLALHDLPQVEVRRGCLHRAVRERELGIGHAASVGGSSTTA